MQKLLDGLWKVLLGVAAIVFALNTNLSCDRVHYISSPEKATEKPVDSSNTGRYPIGYKTKPGEPIPGEGKWQRDADGRWERVANWDK